MALDQEQPRILLVDDVPVNIKILSRILRENYKIFFTTVGKEVVDIAIAKKPDLILLDIMMPEMDGYDVCAKLKANVATAQIPVIFLTALDDQENETKGLEMGAVDYITKPINPAIVRARVSNHIRLRQEIKERRHAEAELEKANQILRQLAALDGLTGIANRRAFDETMQREWLRCARDKLPLTLVLIDVDFFKQYNDTYGHQAGDEVLKQIAQVFSAGLYRPADSAARYGGEEFALILPDTDASGGMMIAEKMRAQVQALNIQAANSKVAAEVTISLGLVAAVPESSVLWATMLEIADKALYEAKQTGRNRICSKNMKVERTPSDVA